MEASSFVGRRWVLWYDEKNWKRGELVKGYSSYFLAIACVVAVMYGTIQGLQILLLVWGLNQWWDAKKALDRGEKKKAIGLGIFGLAILLCLWRSVCSS